MKPPVLDDIYQARARVYRALRPTPLIRHPLLADRTGDGFLPANSCRVRK